MIFTVKTEIYGGIIPVLRKFDWELRVGTSDFGDGQSQGERRQGASGSTSSFQSALLSQNSQIP